MFFQNKKISDRTVLEASNKRVRGSFVQWNSSTKAFLGVVYTGQFVNELIAPLILSSKDARICFSFLSFCLSSLISLRTWLYAIFFPAFLSIPLAAIFAGDLFGSWTFIQPNVSLFRF